MSTVTITIREAGLSLAAAFKSELKAQGNAMAAHRALAMTFARTEKGASDFVAASKIEAAALKAELLKRGDSDAVAQRVGLALNNARAAFALAIPHAGIALDQGKGAMRAAVAALTAPVATAGDAAEVTAPVDGDTVAPGDDVTALAAKVAALSDDDTSTLVEAIKALRRAAKRTILVIAN